MPHKSFARGPASVRESTSDSGGKVRILEASWIPKHTYLQNATLTSNPAALTVFQSTSRHIPMTRPRPIDPSQRSHVASLSRPNDPQRPNFPMSCSSDRVFSLKSPCPSHIVFQQPSVPEIPLVLSQRPSRSIVHPLSHPSDCRHLDLCVLCHNDYPVALSTPWCIQRPSAPISRLLYPID